MKILKHYNVEYYVAPYEADAQLAYLSKINYIDLIITEDSDLLAYGCKCVLYKLGTIDKEPIDVGEEILWENIKNCREIYFKNFSENKFLSFCILCGCDYLKFSGVGPRLSNEALNKFDDHNKFLGFIMNKNIIKGSILETIEKYEKTFLTFKYQVVYCPLEKRMRYFNDINEPCCSFFDNYKNDLSFLGIIQNNNIEKFIKGEINPITKENINEINSQFIHSENIFERAQNSNNILRTEEDEMFIRDEQSDDGDDDRGNFVSKKNFFKKLSKMKMKKDKKLKKLERPKNQISIEAFFDKNNNFRELKKRKHFRKFKRHKKDKKDKNIDNNKTEEVKEDKNNDEINNDENNINSNIFNSYTFDNNKNINIESETTNYNNEIEIYRSKIYTNENLVNSNLSNLKPLKKDKIKENKPKKEKKIKKKKKKKKKKDENEEEEEEIQIHIKMEDLEPKIEKVNIKINTKIEKEENKKELENKEKEENEKDMKILNDFGFSDKISNINPEDLTKPKWIKKVNIKPDKEKEINKNDENNQKIDRKGKKAKKIKRVKKEKKVKEENNEKKEKNQKKENQKNKEDGKKENKKIDNQEKEKKKKPKKEKKDNKEIKLLRRKRKRIEEDEEEKQKEEMEKKKIREDPNMIGLDLFKNPMIIVDQF